ncbi:MAG: ChaN family lipoprotein, partial [Candidatus Aminicenantes bacterium]|nr:ChaN family lipoprotein [Candidatus Aminicenantes bacterium]
MRRTLLAAVLIVLIAIPAALRAEHTDTLPLGPKDRRLVLRTIEAGQILDTRTGKEVTIAKIARRAANADVVMVGEYHDSMACHLFQRDLIREIGKMSPQTVVGFEFFQQGKDDAALATWSRKEANEADLLRATNWYGATSMHYGYTRPVMQAIREAGLTAIGLNAPRALVHRVAGGGLDALGPGERRRFAHV